jgi:hypothetical protein
MDRFKLDRTAFKGQTQKEAANHAVMYKKPSTLRVGGFVPFAGLSSRKVAEDISTLSKFMVSAV